MGESSRSFLLAAIIMNISTIIISTISTTTTTIIIIIIIIIITIIINTTTAAATIDLRVFLSLLVAVVLPLRLLGHQQLLEHELVGRRVALALPQRVRVEARRQQRGVEHLEAGVEGRVEGRVPLGDERRHHRRQVEEEPRQRDCSGRSRCVTVGDGR